MTTPSSSRRWFDGALEAVSTTISQGAQRAGFDSASSPTSNDNFELSDPPPPAGTQPSSSGLNKDGEPMTLEETVQALKEENERLTKATSTIEADYLEQLNNTSRSFREQKNMLHEQLYLKEQETLELNEKCSKMKKYLDEQETRLTEMEREIDEQAKRQDPANHSPSEQLALGQWNEEKREMLEEISMLRAEKQTLIDTASIEEKKEAEGDADGRRLSAELAESNAVVSSLREQLVESSKQLASLTLQLQNVRIEADDRDRYRDQEARDLRLVSDANAELVDSLKKELNDAKKQLDDTKNSNILSESMNVEKLRKELDDAKKQLQSKSSNLIYESMTIEKLRKELSDLKTKNQALENEKESLQKQKSAFAEDEEEELRRKLEEEYQMKLYAIQSISESESGARVAELEAKIERLQGALRESEVTTQTDLRDELESFKLVRDKLRTELSTVKNKKDKEIEELQRKLRERESTIQTLADTSLTFEEQVSTQRKQLEAMKNSKGGESCAELNSLRNELNKTKRALQVKEKNEDTLTSQFQRLRKQAQSSHEELNGLRRLLEEESKERIRLERSLEAAISNPLKASADHSRYQLKERDEAISKLVKQSISQDKIIGDLKDKLLASRQELDMLNGNRENTPSWEEMRQLQKEAEVFAGQVIELDEEIDSLRKQVERKERETDDLKLVVQKLQSSKGKNNGAPSQRVIDLEAEVDELKEANEVQRDELRLLRRRTRETESYADSARHAERDREEAKRQIAELQDEISKLMTEKKELSRQMERTDDEHATEVRVLKANLESARKEQSANTAHLQDELMRRDDALSQMKSSNVDEFEVEALKEELTTIRRNYADQSTSLESAGNTIRELESMLADRNSKSTVVFEEEKEELLAEIEGLQGQLDEAREQLKSTEEQRVIIDDFKSKLENADEAREESEKNIIDSYERKLSLLKLDKDVTIDKLRKELMTEKEGNIDYQKDYDAKIEDYESEIIKLKEEMNAQIELRESRIYGLESTVEAQEQLVKNMRIEMDHLQSSMDATAETRRRQADDMQQELVDVTTKNAKLEREMELLKSQIESDRLKHDSEVTKLEEKVVHLESEASGALRNADDLKMELRLQAVKDRLEKLSWRNTSLKEENVALRERLLKTEGDNYSETANEIAGLKKKIKERDAKIRELESKPVQQAPPTQARASPSRPFKSSPPREKGTPKRLGGLLGMGKRSSSASKTSDK